MNVLCIFILLLGIWHVSLRFLVVDASVRRDKPTTRHVVVLACVSLFIVWVIPRLQCNDGCLCLL